MKPVIAALLKTFAQTQGLEARPQSEQFEHFVNYNILANELNDTFDFISVGTGEHEFGLDGIAVIVNGAMITAVDAVDDHCKFNKYLKCEFYFIQSKTAEKFDSGDVLKFFKAISDFFEADTLKLSQGHEVIEKQRIKNAIYENAHLFSQGLPRLNIYYASLGKWLSDQNLMTIVDSQLDHLRAMSLFDQVAFFPVDSDALQENYFRLQRASSKTIDFPSSVALPEIPQVKEAYIGAISSIEYVKLITEDDGKFKPLVFSDNVRDVQSTSDVNKEIENTLKSSRMLEFPLRNNGITVVCKSLTRIGTKFTLDDYQVVNGCQTSNVLFQNVNTLKKELVLPLKIICSQNEDVTNAVIRGSNRQNEVSNTQFWALEPIHRQIELFFDKVFEGDLKLFYERRRGQYARMPEVERVRIVSPESLLQIFAGMMIDEPHQVTKYYTALLPLVGKSIFNESHNTYVYHACAYVLFKLEQLFRNAYVPRSYRKFRFMIAMSIKYILLGDQKVEFSGKVAEKQATLLVEFAQDTMRMKEVIEKIRATIAVAMTKHGIDEERQAARAASIRNELRFKYSPQLRF